MRGAPDEHIVYVSRIDGNAADCIRNVSYKSKQKRESKYKGDGTMY